MPKKSVKIPPLCIWHLSNFSKFPISVVQNHRLLKILKFTNFSIKSPFYGHKTTKIARKLAKIAPWWISHLSCFSKFPISVVQNHRILEIFKNTIFSLKSPFYAHKTAKIAQKSAEIATWWYTVNNYAIWVKIFLWGLML